jgi:hypothetical protein
MLAKNTFLAIALLSVCGALAQAAPMTITDPGLPGNTQSDYWSNANLGAAANPGYGSYPGNGPWPGPIESGTPNVGTDGDATLHKVADGAAGGPFPATASIYMGGASFTPNLLGGTLAVRDATPLPELTKIVFQLQVGGAFGHVFYNDVLPVLNYNGGSQALVADSVEVLEIFDTLTPDPSGSETIKISTYRMEWDVTGLGITSLEILYSGIQHHQLHQLRLDQTNYVVPEPSSVVLAALGLAGALVLAWTKRRAR